MPCKYVLIFAVVLTLLTGCAGVPPTAAVTPVEPPAQNPKGAAAVPSPNPAVQAGPAKAEAAPAAPEPTVPATPGKKVYLTFDDGPNSRYTGLILDILKRYGVKATFVVVGGNIEKNPDVLRRILAEGHSVVNHTYSHDYKRIYASPGALLDDLQRCNQLLPPAAGSGVKIFRAPGGPSNLGKDFHALLDKNGYKSLGWNVASADTDPRGVSPEQIINNVKDGVIRIEQMKKAPIILMHDGTEINFNADKPCAAVHNYIRNRESDVAALPVIIEFLQARGYTFAGVDENTPPAW